jgi:hypothetical protein
VEKGGSGGDGFYGVGGGIPLPGFGGPGRKIFREIFLKSFLKLIFSAGRYFRKKFSESSR